MRPIARILCGSHLYGCAVSESDRDYKIVYIPSARNILLQCADKLNLEEALPAVEQLKKDAKLTKDPEVEFMSLRQYLKLLCQGQTNALDMFFAPRENFVGVPEPEWYTIQAHKNFWVSKNTSSFVSCCRQQTSIDSTDWKSMYHAVRVAEEALELMRTGKLTFPRPERRVLTAIRLGKIPFEKVSAMIEGSLQIIEKAVKESTLQEAPNWDYADRLVENFYRSAVICRNQ